MKFQTCLTKFNLVANTIVFRYFTSVPHVGGTKESLAQAEYMADQFRLFGFDKVELKKYNALLSVPRVPGNVSMFDADGSVLFNATILEKPLHESEGDPREIFPFNAYTASGQAEVRLTEKVAAVAAAFSHKYFLFRWEFVCNKTDR